MSDTFVPIKQLATEMGMDRSHARRYVLNLRISPAKRRTPESGGQLTLTVSGEEAAFIRRTREEQGFLSAATPVASETGFFYVIQLVPELDPHRAKLRFADNAQTRLAQHRTSAPTATLLKSWPRKRSWERTAIDAMVATGCRPILSEVYEASDVDAVVKRGDEFFALLPRPSDSVPLSGSSPHLNTGSTV